MLKLVKYEIRKNRPLLFSMAAAVALLELYFIGSLLLRSEDNLVASFAMLSLSSLFLALTVFIMGVMSYSRELSQKSSYLIFMTPNSALSVVTSKLLFTLLAGVSFAAALIGLIALDAPLLLNHFGQWRGYYAMIEQYLGFSGVDLAALWLSILLFASTVFLQLLSMVGVAYFSVTLSATWLQNKKGRGAVSAALFVALSYGLARLGDAFAGAWERERFWHALLPMLIQSAVVLLLSLFLSARMLEKKVSL